MRNYNEQNCTKVRSVFSLEFISNVYHSFPCKSLFISIMSKPPTKIPLTTEQKCRVILEQMLQVTKDGDDIILRHNEEGNTVTVYVGFGRKTCGAEDATFDEVVSDLYRLFNKQYGLSFNNLHDEDDWEALEPPFLH